MPAVTPQGSFDYILEADQIEGADPEFITTYTCRKLSSVELSKASDLLNRNMLHEYTRFVITHGLRGWANYKYADGTQIPFEKANNMGHPTSKTIDAMDFAHITELVKVIVERSMATGEQKGK